MIRTIIVVVITSKQADIILLPRLRHLPHDSFTGVSLGEGDAVTGVTVAYPQPARDRRIIITTKVNL